MARAGAAPPGGPIPPWAARRLLARAAARRIEMLGCCAACGHPWSQHPGSGNDWDGMCGECHDEFEHDRRDTTEAGCRRPVPETE